MKVLLDTHVLLWAAGQPERLPPSIHLKIVPPKSALDAEYRDMTADEGREREALAWSEALIEDSADEPHVER